MASGKLIVVGLGPGGAQDMSRRARTAVESCDLIAGYTVYVDLLRDEFPDKEIVTTPMRKEVERCRVALDEATAGRKVAMVCSGDPGVYGMAGLIYEFDGGCRGRFRYSVVQSLVTQAARLPATCLRHLVGA